MMLDSKQDFIQKILERLKTNKISIKPYNDKTINRL
jgi:hypothetical protein